ncbi:MAG: hypothetical protein VBE63_26165 [Lamprobacter sp.]|uniref:hypothetical protein n=1 Tax=Lamprobacter sp. TaxID=3100796 RepID=UPI002B25AA52|nr:hypothetical protein [Lamprobacter sp.]MEA3643390.1 hypothetical protein [Lamprobacter sp.]
MLGNSSERWGLVQQSLHWLVVALVVAQLLVGMTLGGTSIDDPSGRPYSRLTAPSDSAF